MGLFRDNFKDSLRDAALQNDVAKMYELFVSYGVNRVNASDRSGKTALWYAAQAGNWDAVSMLLEHGATVNLSDEKMRSAFATEKGKQALQMGLYQAIMQNNVKRSDELLSYGANIADQNLMDAAKSREMWEFLERNGAPYEKALQKQRLQDVQDGKRKFLEEWDKRAQGNALRKAVIQNDLDTMNHLLAGNKVQVDEPDSKGRTALWYAAQAGNLYAVNALFMHGAKLNVSDNQGCHAFATEVGKDTLQQLLYGKISTDNEKAVDEILSCDVKVVSEDLIYHANTKEMVEFLVRKGVPYQETLKRLKSDNTVAENVEKRKLLEKFEREAQNARTPRMQELRNWAMHSGSPEQIAHEFRAAALRDDVDAMKCLFDCGKIQVDMPNREGKTAMWYAGRTGNLEAASYLASVGAKLNVSDNKGRSAFATEEGEKMIQSLLYRVVESNNGKQVNELLSCGARVMDEGLINHARTKEMVEFLEGKGAPFQDRLKKEPCKWNREDFIINDLLKQLDVKRKKRMEDLKNWAMYSGSPEQIAHEFRSAALRDDVDTMKCLFNCGSIQVDMPNREGRTAMWYAGRAGNLKAASYLASLGAKLNISDNKGHAAFSTDAGKKILQPLLYHVVKTSTRVNQVDDLLAAGANPDDVQLIDHARTFEMVEHLLSKGLPHQKAMDYLMTIDKEWNKPTPSPVGWKIAVLKTFKGQEPHSEKPKQNENGLKTLPLIHGGGRS